MKYRTLLLSFLILTTAFPLAAQKENNLKKHVYALSDSKLKGRKAQSVYSTKALQYIQNDLQNSGLSCHNMSIETQSSKDTDKTKKSDNLYAVIEAKGTNKTNEYIVLSANYTGYGTDTVQGYELVKYSANDNASAVAVLMELGKILQSEQTNLRRGIIVLFRDNNPDSCLNRLSKQYPNIVSIFELSKLGYQIKDKEGNYKEDKYNVVYTLSDRVRKISKLVSPLIINDLSINSNMVIDVTDIRTDIPHHSISTYNYLSLYNDVADSMDYKMMDKLTSQINKVILSVSNGDIQIKPKSNSKIKSVTNEDLDEQMMGAFTKRFKHNSYMGLNLMFGSNHHYYESGNMSGKSAFAFSTGLFYRWQFCDGFALKLDANYEHVNAKREDGDFNANVLSVPLALMLTSGGRPMFEFDIYIGAYYDYILSGELNDKKLDYNDFRRDEWGLQWGTDFRFNRVLIGFYSKTPWNGKMEKRWNGGRITEKTWYFKLGYRL